MNWPALKLPIKLVYIIKLTISVFNWQMKKIVKLQKHISLVWWVWENVNGSKMVKYVKNLKILSINVQVI